MTVAKKRKAGGGRKKEGQVIDASFTTAKHDISKLREIAKISNQRMRLVFRKLVDKEYERLCEEMNIEPKEFPPEKRYDSMGE